MDAHDRCFPLADRHDIDASYQPDPLLPLPSVSDVYQEAVNLGGLVAKEHTIVEA